MAHLEEQDEIAQEEGQSGSVEIPCGDDRKWTIVEAGARSAINRRYPTNRSMFPTVQVRSFYAGCDLEGNIHILDSALRFH